MEEVDKVPLAREVLILRVRSHEQSLPFVNISDEILIESFKNWQHLRSFLNCAPRFVA
jgi:hypothetical protein